MPSLSRLSRAGENPRVLPMRARTPCPFVLTWRWIQHSRFCSSSRMLQRIPLLWRKLEFASAPCVAVSFWALAALVHIKLQGDVVKPLVLGAMLLCCLLLLGVVSHRWWKSLGTPGLLLLASIASYLFIASGTSLATGTELLAKDVARQGFFFVVTLAAILGCRWLLEQIGVEALLKWTLVILVASCAVVLASPLLRDIGVLPEYRSPYRMTGTFTDPNDAGFIACVTVVLALVFQSNRRQHALGYLGLVLGCAAALASVSYTAAIVLSMMLTLFLLLNVRRLRQNLLYACLTVLCMAGILVWHIPGTPMVSTEKAWIVDSYEPKRVGGAVTAFLVNDRLHWADDNPVNPWRWQRADARPGDADTPDDATWTNIEHALSPNYTPVGEDSGKFLRAYVSYEKNGTTHHAQTNAIGPIMAASAATTTDASAVVQPQETLGDIEQTFRDKADSNSDIGRVRSRRSLLWKMGFHKALESPIVGHGLHQLQILEGAPIGNQGTSTGVHNVYLMLIGEAGVAPLVLYLLSLFFLMRVRWTVPKSLGRDAVVGWVVVMALYGLSYHHLLTMGAYNFLIGLACGTAAFLVQRHKEPTTTWRQTGKNSSRPVCETGAEGSLRRVRS